MIGEGDKVLCVDDRFHPSIAQLYTELVSKGRVYCVRAVRLGIRLIPQREGDLSLLLVGISNPSSEVAPYLERGFSSSRFRKVEPRKQAESRPEQKVDPETIPTPQPQTNGLQSS